MDYMAKINELTASKAGLIAQADKLIAENKFGEELTKLQGDIKNTAAQIAQVTELAAASANGAVQIPAIPTEPKNDKGIRLFENFADQLRAVKNAAGGVVDDRLSKLNKEFYNATGMNEGIGTEGGFAVQTDFAGMLMDTAAKAGNILPLVDKYEVSPAVPMPLSGLKSTKHLWPLPSSAAYRFTGRPKQLKLSRQKLRLSKKKSNSKNSWVWLTRPLSSNPTAILFHNFTVVRLRLVFSVKWNPVLSAQPVQA